MGFISQEMLILHTFILSQLKGKTFFPSIFKWAGYFAGPFLCTYDTRYITPELKPLTFRLPDRPLSTHQTLRTLLDFSFSPGKTLRAFSNTGVSHCTESFIPGFAYPPAGLKSL